MIDKEYDEDMKIFYEYNANEKALEVEIRDFQIWYKLYCYSRRIINHDPYKFKKEVERRLRRIHELSLKTETHFYTEMMDIIDQEDTTLLDEMFPA